MPIRTATIISLVATLASALTAADGPRLVKDIAAGSANLELLSGLAQESTRKTAEANGLLFFIRRIPAVGRLGGLQAWRSDGSDSGTFAVGVANGRLIQGPLGVGNRIFWLTQDVLDGCQLWSSDGSPGGTRGQTLFPLGRDSVSGNIVASNGAAYFIHRRTNAPDEGARWSLWSSDGLQAGEVAEMPVDYSSTHLVATRRKLFFTCSLAGIRNQLWCFDPTTQGFTQLTFDYPFEVGRDLIQGLSSAGDLAFFSKATPDGDHLWRSDGTIAGTFALPAPGGIIRQADFGGRLLFVPNDPVLGEEPWISDGTIAGTRLIADLLPGPAGSRPSPLVIANGQAFFVTQTRPDPDFGPLRLWRTDGTTAGTTACLDDGPSSYISLEHSATIGRTLYFSGHDPQHGSELWQCDGTPAGTRRVSGINPGPANADPWSITEAGGRLFMHATDASHGRELWIHDADRTPPVLSVATPVRPTAVVTGDRCRFSGTARDAVGVTRLTVTLRGATTKQVVIANEPKPDAPVTWDLTLAIQPGITEAMIGAEDEAGNRSVLRRMLVARTTPTPGKTMHVGFLEPTSVVTGRHVSDGPAFPGATVYALDDDGAPATDVTYRYAGGTTRDGAAVSNDDGTWTIAGASLSAGESTLAVTARDADGTSADARLEVVVPQATSQAAPSGNRCGGGSGIAALALALIATALGLRRRA